MLQQVLAAITGHCLPELHSHLLMVVIQLILIFLSTMGAGQVCVSSVNSCGTSIQRCMNVKGAPANVTAI
jgi:hypothetical protein